MVWGLVPIAYLLGTFPSAVMVARSKGIDITSVGSRNPGASNVARTMGSGWGILVFVLDGLKGAIPALVGTLLDEPKATYALIAAAVLGHMFPVTRRFVGGKGVATVGGGLVILHPLVFVALTAIWVAMRKFTGKASLGSLLIAVGLPVGVALTGAPAWEVVASAALGALVLVRHTDNIKRLVQGRELSASRSRSGA
ncbi:MAG: glycerol-3-phosphate 1-O-acyltransferase PlsY [Acidimicrobiales bacterium]